MEVARIKTENKNRKQKTKNEQKSEESCESQSLSDAVSGIRLQCDLASSSCWFWAKMLSLELGVAPPGPGRAGTCGPTPAQTTRAGILTRPTKLGQPHTQLLGQQRAAEEAGGGIGSAV